MADPAIDYAYRYREPSRLEGPGASAPTLRLATAGGPAENPRLFRGTVVHPVLFADALLAIGAVARSRFHVPPAMLARILLLADPVATAAQDRLRFEAFSSCASVEPPLSLVCRSVTLSLSVLATAASAFSSHVRWSHGERPWTAFSTFAYAASDVSQLWLHRLFAAASP